MNRQLGCFHFPAIMSNAESTWVCSYLCGMLIEVFVPYPRSGVAGSYVTSSLSYFFWRNLHTDFHRAAQVYPRTNRE